MTKQKYYFTFGCGMGLANYYVIINAYNESIARNRMVELFGLHWCTSYNEDCWRDENGITQDEQWGYKLFAEYDSYEYPEIEE